MTPLTRADCAALDRADPLAPLRAQFHLPPGAIYLDGNSLGPLPAAAPARLAEVVQREWGEGLIGSWNSAGWLTLAQRVGDKIARLVGAGPGELVVADSTSINLYKALGAALALVRQHAPLRRAILSETGNFPTDLYLAEALARQHGGRVDRLDADALVPHLAGDGGHDVAVLTLTHVNYRSGRLHDLAGLTAAAHAAGALVVWDLAHSTGAVEVDLKGADADFAVGCGYKYLNGGPGAPGFIWVHPRHVDRAPQPLPGWIGHAAPFDFAPGYRPAAGIARYQCGTPPVLSLAALECGVDTVLAAEPLGGVAALRRKSLALTRLFAAEVQRRCAGYGLRVVSPAADASRGSQVALACAEGGYAIVQALIERGVIGDFRAPDVLRFGFAPLYLRYVDVWDAASALHEVLASGQWREPRFQPRQAVT